MRIDALSSAGDDAHVSPLRTLLAAGLALVLFAPASMAQGEHAGPTRAVGYAALLPGGTDGAVAATASGPTTGSSEVLTLRPVGGGTVASIRVKVSATSDGQVGRSQGTVEIRDANILDGRVVAGLVRMSARTTSGDGAGEDGLTEGSITGLVVDGVPVDAGPGSRVDVAGVGTVIFLEHVADGEGGLRANALRLEVTDPQAATVIGEPFVLGHLDLSASPGPPPAAAEPAPPDPTPPAAAPVTPASPTRSEPAEEPTPVPSTTPRAPVVTPAPLGLPRRAAPAVRIATDDGYVFPVAGQASFGDDYGAPRAGTGWHHGNDVFAPTGTPLVAVADGTLSRVGVNTLGGNRLWLTDEAGNTFYYAHLSAYAPVAVEGAHVTAGQVIGFVGNTGQAITTPPHLHFEVHPGGGDSVNPYPYLVAWQRGSDIPRAFIQAAVSPSPAPALGAVLVDGVPEIDIGPPAADDDGLATPAT
jgi:hypothetical protein